MRQQARQRRKRKAKKQRAAEHWTVAHERRQDTAPELMVPTTPLVVEKISAAAERVWSR